MIVEKTASRTLRDLVPELPRFLFFTGKGGVGKTTLSCAIAVALADAGKRVLLISTDPASNLGEVLGIDLGATPMDVPSAPRLRALNIDPEAAARAYRERMVTPYRGVLPEAVVASIEEQLSGACTTEIAAFNEFANYLGNAAATAEYDHVVFDTAPTGHTLRLLRLPAAWKGFLDTNKSGTSCLGPLAGLQAQRELYAETLAALADPTRTLLALVSRPERTALAEAERSRAELSALGLLNIRLFLNGVFSAESHDDPVAETLAARQRQALADMPEGLKGMARTIVPLRSFNVTGVGAVRLIANSSSDDGERIVSPPHVAEFPEQPHLCDLIAEFERRGRGVILTMGKGGVGKTTIAAAVAVELARRGYRTHLTTTDPAAHVEQTLGDSVENLTVSRIDPVAEVAAYRDEVLNSAGKGLDEEALRLLEEDLRSPCTEEIAVFRAFAAKVDAGREGFVVLDTAPTGHTLLLLDATEAYHREVSRTRSDLPESVKQLLPRLRDPNYSRVILVTLPEATPVHEAVQLQHDLVRAGIRPFAWVINQCLSAVQVNHPLLRARQLNEIRFIEEVRQVSERYAVVPWLAEEPTGVRGLKQITEPPFPERRASRPQSVCCTRRD